MCGIVAWFSPKDNITKSISLLGALNSQVRGDESVGILIKQENSTPKVIKMVGSVTENFNRLYLSMPAKSSTGIVHTRMPSRGEVNIKNTHPFYNDRFVFVHNGTITVWKTPEEEKFIKNKMEGDTDSEEMFWLFVYYKNKGDTTTAAIEKTVKSVNGTYTCVMYDKKTDTLWLWGNNARYLIEKDGVVWFFSTKDMAEATLGKIKKWDEYEFRTDEILVLKREKNKIEVYTQGVAKTQKGGVLNV